MDDEMQDFRTTIPNHGRPQGWQRGNFTPWILKFTIFEVVWVSFKWVLGGFEVIALLWKPQIYWPPSWKNSCEQPIIQAPTKITGLGKQKYVKLKYFILLHPLICKNSKHKKISVFNKFWIGMTSNEMGKIWEIISFIALKNG